MRKFLLGVSLVPNSDEKLLSFSSTINGFNEATAPYRHSPVYSVVDLPEDFAPLPNNNGALAVCFCDRPFQAVANLVSSLAALPKNTTVFVSHGLGSVVITADTLEDVDRAVSSIGSPVRRVEKWTIVDTRIVETTILSLKADECPGLVIDIPWELIDVESYSVARTLFSSLSQAYTQAHEVCPEFCPLVDWFCSYSQLIVSKSLYLRGGENESFLRKAYQTCFPNYGGEDIEREIVEYQNILCSNDQVAIRLHQLKDDLYQISAIAQNFFIQSFSGVPPILSSTYDSGDHSLLGTGGAIRALNSLYSNARDAFHPLSDTEKLRAKMDRCRSPKFPNYRDLDDWAESIDLASGVESVIALGTACNSSAYHFVYLSNRLGFRETKYSISAAIQILSLGAITNWSICTFFHEFIHAHVRALLSAFYPKATPENEVRFQSVYERYCQISQDGFVTESLLEFLEVSLMDVATRLYHYEQDTQNKSTSRLYYDVDVVKGALREMFIPISELIVHILDFNYFYNSNRKCYIKGIWASWAELPFTRSRLREYLLRTVCAIAGSYSRDENASFDSSVAEIRSALLELSTENSVNQSLFKDALANLDDFATLKLKFSIVFPLVVIASRLLVSSSIKARLADPDAAPQDDDSYGLDMVPGEFQDRAIEVPITFLFDYYRNVFDKNNNIDFSSSVDSSHEYLSLWLLILLSSAEPVEVCHG